MAQWYIKEFSKLLNVSIRTLHHYDEIGLLKPSIRLPNGYRLYSEADLLRLQQIIALKFFGFELSQVQQLLDKESDALKHFQAQKQSIQSHIEQLQNADRTLGDIIHDLERDGSIKWDRIIQLIEDYRMSSKTKMIWGPDFDPEKQKGYQKYLVESGLATQHQIDEVNAKTQTWDAQKVQSIKEEQDSVLKALAEAVDQQLPPDDPQVQKLISRHFVTIKNFWTPNRESYIGLAQLYSSHPDFEAFFVAYHPKLIPFLVEAMTIYANKELT